MLTCKKFYIPFLLIIIVLFQFCKEEDSVQPIIGQKPTVSTLDASNISSTAATLNGIVNPNNLPTDISFEYGKSSGYGYTVNSSHTPLSGSNDEDVTITVAHLLPATTYHYRVKAVNSEDTVYGENVTFNTLGKIPAATTLGASNITTVSATIKGVVNPNDLISDVSFEFGPSLSYGYTINAIESPLSGSGNINVSIELAKLLPGTTYNYRVRAVNSVGSTFGENLTFTTFGMLPTAVTQPVSGTTITSTTFNGMVNPNDLKTDVSFEFGLTTAYGFTINASQSPLTGSSSTTVNAVYSHLTPGKTFHYRVKAVNSLGVKYGSDMTFNTLGMTPSVVTSSATNISSTSAVLNGLVNPNELSTDVVFEYGPTASYGYTINASQSPLSGSVNNTVSISAFHLIPGRTYHYRVKAINSLGTVYGNDMTFTTL